jgi:hypothetical protein
VRAGNHQSEKSSGDAATAGWNAAVRERAIRLS